MAIAAATCRAYALARATVTPRGSLASLDNRVSFCTDLAMLLDGLVRPGYKLRGGRGAPSLHGRIGIELPRYLQEGKVPFGGKLQGSYLRGAEGPASRSGATGNEKLTGRSETCRGAVSWLGTSSTLRHKCLPADHEAQGLCHQRAYPAGDSNPR